MRLMQYICAGCELLGVCLHDEIRGPVSPTQQRADRGAFVFSFLAACTQDEFVQCEYRHMLIINECACVRK